MTHIQWALPRSRSERLTETDVAIICALSNDARKSFVQVARELNLSPMTVRNRIVKLRGENTIFAVPALSVGSIPELIPMFVSFSYSNSEMKGFVDRAMMSHFAPSYLSIELADPNNGSIFLSVSTVTEVRECLDWTKSQPGVASARADILIKSMMFPEKRTEPLLRHERASIERKEFP
jgi:DNA-binding Lrp family transcriptional regulator